MLTYLAEKFRSLSGGDGGQPRSGAEKEENVKSCLSCQLISGFGLAGAGGYVGVEGMKRKSPIQKYIMLGVASGFIGLGVARLLDLPPFTHHHVKETSN